MYSCLFNPLLQSQLFVVCKLDWNSKMGNLRNGWKSQKLIQSVIRVLVVWVICVTACMCVCGRGYIRCTKKVWCLPQKGLKDKRMFSHTDFVHPHVSLAKGKVSLFITAETLNPNGPSCKKSTLLMQMVIKKCLDRNFLSFRTDD